MKMKLVYKGGPGSGHHGHAGRPGKVGGSSSGGGGSSGGRLADGVPIPQVNVESLRKLHKNWSDEQINKYAQKVQQDYNNRDWNGVNITDGPESYKNKVRNGRAAVKAVHEEVKGFETIYTQQQQLDRITGGGEGTRGAYAARRIYIGPKSSSETYVHEYGHYIDNMLGTRIGKSYYSVDAGIFPKETPNWLAKEGFAEFYSSWINAGANVKQTHSVLSNIGGSFWRGESGLKIVQDLDTELRYQLDMK